MENWKDIPEYEDFFMISDHGNIFSKRTNKVLKIHVNKQGYCTVSTRIGGRTGKAVCFKIHRLVALLFLDNSENKPEVNHKDGNKQNNHHENLEWVTSSENMQHAYDNGLANARSGETNTQSKLTDEQANVIRTRRANGEKCVDLAKEYGVHHMQISRITRNISYKN